MKNKTILPFNRSTIQLVKTYAFTLAETLIVIGIIGVVAALTLPNLNHATGDKEKVTRVNKIYSTLVDAYGRAEAIYGPLDEWFTDLGEENWESKSERFAKHMIEFLKISKDCGSAEEGCFSKLPLLMPSGNEDFENYYELHKDYSYMVLLPDGMSVAFNANFSKIDTCSIFVDIDGPSKGKNQQGNDIFEFTVTNINYGCEQTSEFNLLPAAHCNYNGNGLQNNFTLWVIENGNLDYLKCPDELNWETQTSCK